MFRKRVPGVGSGDRKSSAADGSQSDWRQDQTVTVGNNSHSYVAYTYLPTFNSSLSKVVVISAHLPSEHSLFHARVPLSATQVLLSQDRVCGTVYRLRYKDRSAATDSLGDV